MFLSLAKSFLRRSDLVLSCPPLMVEALVNNVIDGEEAIPLVTASSLPSHHLARSRSRWLPGVEIEHGYHGGPPARWQLVPMIQLTHLRSGSVWICCGSECALLESGDTVVSTPAYHPRVTRRLTDSAETLEALIDPRRFEEEMARRRIRPNGLGALIVRDGRLDAVLEALCRAVDEDRDADTLQIAFTDLLDQIRRAMSNPATRRVRKKPARPEVEIVRTRLQERFAEPVALDDLAEEVGMSKFHLLRLFRQEVGTTPHAYQVHLRVSRAREMLDRGVCAAEVALACGFADQAHFTRCFKSIVGFTPAAFARLG